MTNLRASQNACSIVFTLFPRLAMPTLLLFVASFSAAQTCDTKVVPCIIQPRTGDKKVTGKLRLAAGQVPAGTTVNVQLTKPGAAATQLGSAEWIPEGTFTKELTTALDEGDTVTITQAPPETGGSAQAVALSNTQLTAQECTPLTLNVSATSVAGDKPAAVNLELYWTDADGNPLPQGSNPPSKTSSSVSGTVSVKASPSSSGDKPLTISVTKGKGQLPLPRYAPGTYTFTGTFLADNNYQTTSGSPPVLTIEKASSSNQCIYPMAPLLSTVVGVDVEGASSTSPAARFMGNTSIDLPVFPTSKEPHRLTDIEKAKVFLGGSLRIAAMAQPGALSSSAFTEGYFASAVNATPDKIVQAWEGTTSVSVRLWHTNLGFGTFDSGKPASPDFPRKTLFTTSLLLSAGFISPLSASQANPPVYYATNQIITDTTNGILPAPTPPFASTCSYTTGGSPTCYVAFVPTDRERFYRHYEAGFRYRIYGEDFNHGVLRFPGILDLTVGQNEYVTAGKLNGVVVHFGGILPVPIPKVDGIYAFGALDSELNGPVGGGAQLLLNPVPSTANVTYLSPNVYTIPVSQPNRDRYRFGVGVDLYHLLTAKAQKQGTSSASNAAEQ